MTLLMLLLAALGSLPLHGAMMILRPTTIRPSCHRYTSRCHRPDVCFRKNRPNTTKTRLLAGVAAEGFSYDSIPTTNNANEKATLDDDPFGPPRVLALLKLQETYTPHYLIENGSDKNQLQITRVSFDPDIFVVRNFLPNVQDHATLKKAAQQQGLKEAGTRQSESQSIRKSSYLAWIDPYATTTTTTMTTTTTTDGNNNDDGNNSNVKATAIARTMANLVQTLLVHDALQPSSRQSSPYYSCEDLQLAKYDPQGCFDFHHDGFNRFITVLTYLDCGGNGNAVGGTYFPLAQTTYAAATDSKEELIAKLKRCNQRTGHHDPLAVEQEFQVGQDGLLVVGQEGAAAYSIAETETNQNAVVHIQPGDAVVFYNYKYRWNTRSVLENFRAMHAGLRVPPGQEKWIATNWLRIK